MYVCIYIVVSLAHDLNLVFSFRNLHTRRVKSIKKGSLFLKGMYIFPLGVVNWLREFGCTFVMVFILTFLILSMNIQQRKDS